jgi:hypothetical protein
LECWKYGGEDDNPNFRIDSIDDNMIDHWLKEPYLLRDGEEPSAGLKVIQMPQTDAKRLATQLGEHGNGGRGKPQRHVV